MPANPNDNTTLLGPGGDVISDEFLDPNQSVRQEQLLSLLGYKLPRSKIAVGKYGVDLGDATGDNPLAAESRTQRQIAELDVLRQETASMMAFDTRAAERMPLLDSRGSYLDHRGQR